jgi:SAM-dependent methyltransferase
MEGTTTMPTVDPVNADQVREWDGDGGAFWASHARQFDEAVAAHHGPFLDAAGIQATDRVLDIGCGAGHTTRDAARAAHRGRVLGVDLSSQLLAIARSLAEAEGLANVQLEQADAQIYPFEAEGFDIAISRTGAMFFGDAPAAFANIARALRSGGRLILLTWRPAAENEWLRDFTGAYAQGRELPPFPPEGPHPFSLSDPERVRRVLGGAGFTEIELVPLDVPLYFGPDVDQAEELVLGVTGWMLEGLDAPGRAQALADLRASLVRHDSGAGVAYDSATWIITARKP